MFFSQGLTLSNMQRGKELGLKLLGGESKRRGKPVARGLLFVLRCLRQLNGPPAILGQSLSGAPVKRWCMSDEKI